MTVKARLVALLVTTNVITYAALVFLRENELDNVIGI